MNKESAPPIFSRLSYKAIHAFQKVYYEVMGIIIPYAQAEEEANRFIRILVLTFPSNKIRTMETLVRRHILDKSECKRQNYKSDFVSNFLKS
jgi:hypothetical protein